MMAIRRILSTASCALVFFLLTAPSTASAGSLINFIHEGTTDEGFTLNGEVFPGTFDFIITAIGDIGDRQQSGTGWFINHTSAMIEIVGVGSFAILTPTRTFVNSVGGLVGFSRGGSAGTDLFTGPRHPDFLDWDMTTPIGPIHGNDGRLSQWAREPFIETTGGRLRFFDAEGIPVTFTAIVVPGPPPLAALSLAALICPRRRRRQC